MINFNGNIINEDNHSLTNNRAFLFGDGIFETLKILDQKVLFLEDHYFRLMASMRILRMQIPMDFTMEYFESQILDLVNHKKIANSARARVTVFRNSGGLYLPKTRTISFLIQAEQLQNMLYINNDVPYEIELYKDFVITKQLLSTLKTTNRVINITASIFSDENGYQNCLLMNDSKNIIEAINGNIFMVSGNKISTPPVSEGCINGVLRKQLIAIIRKNPDLEIIEEPISPFDLQKADELIITNVITGIQSVSQYRKKTYTNTLAKRLLTQLNAQLRFN